MKTYGEMYVWLHPFLTSAQLHRSSLFNPKDGRTQKSRCSGKKHQVLPGNKHRRYHLYWANPDHKLNLENDFDSLWKLPVATQGQNTTTITWISFPLSAG